MKGCFCRNIYVGPHLVLFVPADVIEPNDVKPYVTTMLTKDENICSSFPITFLVKIR